MNRKKKAGAEFIRRHKIGTLVNQLCAVLPNSAVCKNNRQPDILRSAIKYIKECQECQLPSLEDERERKYALKINSLEKHIKELEVRCQRFAHLLKINGICNVYGNSQHGESKGENGDSDFSDAVTCNVEKSIDDRSVSSTLSAPLTVLVEQKNTVGRPKRPSPAFSSALILPQLRPKLDPDLHDNQNADLTEPSTAAECPNVNDNLQSTVNLVFDSVVTSTNNADLRNQNGVVVNSDLAESPSDFISDHLAPIVSDSVAPIVAETVLLNVADPITSIVLLKQDIAVETDILNVPTAEAAVQTDFEIVAAQISCESKFVDRALSPIYIVEERCNKPQPPVPQPQIKKPIRKCNIDAIAEIVSFVATNVNPPPASLPNKPDESNSKTQVNNVAPCQPSMLRVEDILHQPVAPVVVNAAPITNRSTSYGDGAGSGKAPSKRSSSTTKQSTAKRAAHDKTATDRNLPQAQSSTGWHVFDPNFSPAYSQPPNLPSNGAPKSTVAKQQGAETSTAPSNKRAASKNNTATQNALARQQVADFSIDSLSGDMSTAAKQRNSQANSAAHHKASTAASKLTHFPCSTANSNVLPQAQPIQNNSQIGQQPPPGMPMSYSDMSMFLPFHSPSRPPAPNFVDPQKNKGKQQQQQQQQSQQPQGQISNVGMFGMGQVPNNSLISTDGNQAVNLNDSIFDFQGNGCGNSLNMQAYNTVGQAPMFYNFANTPKIASNTTSAIVKDRASDLNVAALSWQCAGADHSGAGANFAAPLPSGVAHPYAQSLEALQSANQKVQNFQIASMFPESANSSLSSNVRSLQQQSAVVPPPYRWNDATRFPPHDQSLAGNMSSSLPVPHQYSGSADQANAWLPQVFSYTNHDRSSTNSFMPSFNFSQSNNHS